MKRRTLPKTSEALDRAYIDCRDNKKFRIADKESFSDYMARSQRDIASAENDFNFGDFYWARVFIQDVNDFRIQRNFALYKPKAWEDVTKDDIKKELDKIKKNMAILGGLL